MRNVLFNAFKASLVQREVAFCGAKRRRDCLGSPSGGAGTVSAVTERADGTVKTVPYGETSSTIPVIPTERQRVERISKNGRTQFAPTKRVVGDADPYN